MEGGKRGWGAGWGGVGVVGVVGGEESTRARAHVSNDWKFTLAGARVHTHTHTHTLTHTQMGIFPPVHHKFIQIGLLLDFLTNR